MTFDSEQLISKSIKHIDDKMFVTKLQYTVTTGQQSTEWDAAHLAKGTAFKTEEIKPHKLDYSADCQVKYDLIGKIAEGVKLTRVTVAKILAGIKPSTFFMFQENPEVFIAKGIRLINEQKARMIVEQITYNQTDGTYDGAIFTAEKDGDFSKAYRAEKNVQDYVFCDGYASDGNSVERRMAKEMDAAAEVNVYAKLPKGFAIPTPVGNYSPDWAIVFNKGMVKHIFFIAETKGSLDSLQLRPVENAKIQCAKRLFSELSTEDVVYHEVSGFHELLDIMEKL